MALDRWPDQETWGQLWGTIVVRHFLCAPEALHNHWNPTGTGESLLGVQSAGRVMMQHLAVCSVQYNCIAAGLLCKAVQACELYKLQDSL